MRSTRIEHQLCWLQRPLCLPGDRLSCQEIFELRSYERVSVNQSPKNCGCMSFAPLRPKVEHLWHVRTGGNSSEPVEPHGFRVCCEV